MGGGLAAGLRLLKMTVSLGRVQNPPALFMLLYDGPNDKVA